MDAHAVRERAESLYRRGQFLCSEAVVFAFNEAMGEPMPKEIAKLASGFPVGMGAVGTGGCTCGALAGGVMVIGMLHGRCTPGEEAPLVLDKARELHDWFKAEKRTTCCRALIAGLEFGSDAHIDQCVRFTGDVGERLAGMLNA